MNKDRTRDAAGKPQPGRDKTDESLRKERNKTDLALEAKHKRTQEMADDIIERAREQADEILDTAREKADEKLVPVGAGVPLRGTAFKEALTQERIEEDEALKQERATADDNLRWEREEQSRILAALLPLEREQTDRFLLTERAHSDEAVANRDDFMSIVSHDLRNLLAGIASHAKLLAIRASDSDEGRRTLAGIDRIERYVARMNRLIGDLVDVASIDAGKLAVHPQLGDATELIEEAVTPFEQAAQDKGLLLRCASEGPVLLGVFDKERMLQVLANLIANAMRFTPRGGAITLAAARAGDELRVSVLDTGDGIAEDMCEVIFDRFTQGSENHHRGMGLGLYISRCIVDAQGGRIWAESNNGGRGSAFHITIPAPLGVSALAGR